MRRALRQGQGRRIIRLSRLRQQRGSEAEATVLPTI